MDELGLEGEAAAAGAPVWAVFGDLMAGLLGAFVLMLVCVLAAQLDLVAQLEAEVHKRMAEEQRRETLEQRLEQALAGPLASGRVTLDHGRIGINGSVLFAPNSDQLQPEGRQVLKSLAAPLAAYLGAREQLLMVSGFTDDRPVRERNPLFTDNLELSAQRALTVTRALLDEGLPPGSVFAAAFGAAQPVASNADAAGRARNRRVEMAPVPRTVPAPTAGAASEAGRPRD